MESIFAWLFWVWTWINKVSRKKKLVNVQNGFRYQYGAWVSGRRYPISKGKISGEKRSDRKWIITIDVETIPFEAESPISVVFDEKFILE